jgi:hypothetical protein
MDIWLSHSGVDYVSSLEGRFLYAVSLIVQIAPVSRANRLALSMHLYW